MKRWPRTVVKLEKAIGKFDYDFTNAAGVATIFAREAVKKGYRQIISVGGDGTLHEVLQGLFESKKAINPDIILGILPFGTGTDFARSMKMSNDEDESIVRLRGKKVSAIDIGAVTFKNHQGKEELQYFINMADVGLGGDVAERANNGTKALGGFATYLYSSVVSFASYKPKEMKITADEHLVEGPITSVFVANGEYFGGGMRIAPPAIMDDGLFEVVILKELSKWEVLSLMPRLYSGKLLMQPGVEHFRAKTVTVESSEEVLLNLDGEQPGKAPVTFKVLPQAIKIKT